MELKENSKLFYNIRADLLFNLFIFMLHVHIAIGSDYMHQKRHFR